MAKKRPDNTKLYYQDSTSIPPAPDDTVLVRWGHQKSFKSVSVNVFNSQRPSEPNLLYADVNKMNNYHKAMSEWLDALYNKTS